ncbi:dihydrofolate reductase family protein [Nonomuraea pusilla]|uniref:dihydrofolate reductase family protein n=1 Tax=Nonomuraea pusilla TaxID=46177 RepID=UPI003328EB50
MSKVVADISVSLDGFATGPDPDVEHGLGRGGELLHAWARRPTDIDARLLETATAATGALVMGRRTFQVVDGPYGWSETRGYGARGPHRTPPVYVVTHEPPASVRLTGRYTFVTGGLIEAVTRARAAAGNADTVIMGGASTIRQAIDGGLLDELRLHLAPILLGSGTPLFAHARPCQWEPSEVHFSPLATHLTYHPLT